jgi:hypothetical protein
MAFMDFFRSQRPYDPYQQVREQQQNLAGQIDKQYKDALASPSWGLPDPEMIKMLESRSEEDVRSQHPGAGGSGWLQDRINSEKLKLRLGLVEKRQAALDKLRGYQTQLVGNMQGKMEPGQPSPFMNIMSTAFGQAGGNMLTEGIKGLFGKGNQQQTQPTQPTAQAPAPFGGAPQQQPPQPSNASGGFSV